jgi:hypothetical protein
VQDNVRGSARRKVGLILSNVFDNRDTTLPVGFPSSFRGTQGSWQHCIAVSTTEAPDVRCDEPKAILSHAVLVARVSCTTCSAPCCAPLGFRSSLARNVVQDWLKPDILVPIQKQAKQLEK